MRKWLAVSAAVVFGLSMAATFAMAGAPLDPKKKPPQQQQQGMKPPQQQQGVKPPQQQGGMKPPQQQGGTKPPQQQGTKPPTQQAGPQTGTVPQFPGQQFQRGGQGFMPGTNPNVMYQTGQ